MKNETLEEEIKLIKQDLVNMRSDIAKELNHIVNQLDFLKANLKIAFERLSMNYRHKYTCTHCEGIGTIYISPISDCGQSNKCGDCNGSGVLWI